MYLPYFWATAKTYYELNGQRPDDYNWVNPLFNYLNSLEEIKAFIQANPPSVFGVSLYVWNHTMALKVASWVKQEFPECIVVSGGPHQYFKHESNWFETMSFLDASLAGDEYGELTMCDILDNLDNLNWNKVHAVVYPSKNRKVILTSRKTSPKRDFSWDYSVYTSQFADLLAYKTSMEAYDSTYTAQGLLETTRGCPYACTFCDWGGGTASKVLIKDMQYVRQDIEGLAELGVEGVFFCDANLGILKDRDVAVMQHIADTKKNYTNFFSMHYGGYAKTTGAMPYIRKIIEIEADNYLMRALTYKLSLQTLDQETLKNIDRTDVAFEEYLALSQHLQSNYGYDAYAEIIAGLPGITPNKFYHEIDVFAANNINMNFYDWYLLPETPSYSKEYRDKYKISTVKKQYGNHNLDTYSEQFERESEIVVATYSYDLHDYKVMHISYALYRAFWTGGFLASTIAKINKLYQLPLGEFTKIFYRSFFTDRRAGKFIQELNANINQTFDKFFSDTDSMLLFTTDDVKSADIVKLITMSIFLHLEEFEVELASWVQATWPQIFKEEVLKDLAYTITAKNFRTKQGWLFRKYYTNEIFYNIRTVDEVEAVFDTYSSSSIPVPVRNILRAKTVLI